MLIRKEREDNQRRRRLSEEEETKLLAVAPPFLRSMIITALDTGMRQGEMLKLRFGDIDWKRQLIVLRGVTTKSKKTRVVPTSTTKTEGGAGMVTARRGKARRSQTRRCSSATRPASRSAVSVLPG